MGLLTFTGSSFFSHEKGLFASSMGYSAKKSKENFLVVSLIRAFKSLLSIASKSLRSYLKAASLFSRVNMSVNMEVLIVSRSFIWLCLVEGGV